MKIRRAFRFLVTMFGFAILALVDSGVGMASASTPPGLVIDTRLTAVQDDNVWYTYYDNYFYTHATCTARGRAITDPGSSQYIPGLIDFFCYVNIGDEKFSMDVYST